jgi:hypothetical protein
VAPATRTSALTGPWVPTLPGGTLRDAEGAEVYQLDLIALLKRLRDDIEDAVYGTGDVGLGYAGALGYGGDEVGLVHDRLPGVWQSCR